VVGGTVLACFSETALVFGAETRNAQLVANQKHPGRIATVHAAWKPWGHGVGIHVARNMVATAGLRLFHLPCTYLVENVTGRSTALTVLMGSLMGNIIGVGMSTPFHQLYGFTCTTPELWTMSVGERRAKMIQFLKEQYTVTTKEGKTRVSSVMGRDLAMRCGYGGVLATMYITLERALIANWPK
jgi:hypothetical protein